MSKFGLEQEEPTESTPDFAAQLAAFPISSPRHKIDLAAVDQAAAVHGFVSREAVPPVMTYPASNAGRRRRLGTAEPTRHLAIRLNERQYDRFVAYADLHQLTYHDALTKLLDETGS